MRKEIRATKVKKEIEAMMVRMEKMVPTEKMVLRETKEIKEIEA